MCRRNIDDEPDVAPEPRCSSTSRIASICSAIDIACGLTRWRREKVRSWRVSAAPRCAAMSIASAARTALRVVGRDLSQRRDVAADDHQQVVEVVRDAAGELPERLHLLRLGELRLHLLHRRAAASRRSVMSRVILAKPTSSPLSSRIGVDHDAGPEATCRPCARASLPPRTGPRRARSRAPAPARPHARSRLGVEAREVLTDDLAAAHSP